MSVGLALAATGSYAALLVGALGIGVGGICPSMAAVVLRRTLPGDSIVRAVTIVSFTALVGTGIGFISGGAALHYVTLREYFVIVAIVGAIATTGLYFTIPKAPPADRGTLELTSVALLVGWFVAILFAFSKGPEWGWTNPVTLGLFGAGLLTAFIWVQREYKLETPVIDLTLLRSKQYRRTLFGALTLGMGGLGFSVLFPTIAQVKGAGFGPQATTLQTGFLMLPYAGCGLAGVLIASRIGARGHPLLAAGIGAMGHCLGALWMAFFHNELWQILVGATIYGTGIGLLNCSLNSAIQYFVPKPKAGMAAAMLGLTIAFSASVTPIVYGIILAHKSVPGLPGIPAESQFVIAFLANATVDVMCAIVCFLSLRQPRPSSEAEQGVAAISTVS
jgi:MFS family permease